MEHLSYNMALALFLTISLAVSLTLLSTTLPYLYSLGDSHCTTSLSLIYSAFTTFPYSVALHLLIISLPSDWLSALCHLWCTQTTFDVLGTLLMHLTSLGYLHTLPSLIFPQIHLPYPFPEGRDAKKGFQCFCR